MYSTSDNTIVINTTMSIENTTQVYIRIRIDDCTGQNHAPNSNIGIAAYTGSGMNECRNICIVRQQLVEFGEPHPVITYSHKHRIKTR